MVWSAKQAIKESVFLERHFLAQKYEIKIAIFIFMEVLILGLKACKKISFGRSFTEKMAPYLTPIAIKEFVACNYIDKE